MLMKRVPVAVLAFGAGKAVADPDGFYDDGKIWSPDRDKTDTSDMTLTDDKLAVRGCLMEICRDGVIWTRVQ